MVNKLECSFRDPSGFLLEKQVFYTDKLIIATKIIMMIVKIQDFMTN